MHAQNRCQYGRRYRVNLPRQLRGTAPKAPAQPERRAHDLLHTYINANFQDRVSVCEEIATGADRLDELLKGDEVLSVRYIRCCGSSSPQCLNVAVEMKTGQLTGLQALRSSAALAKGGSLLGMGLLIYSKLLL